jgi:hypothetical protein
MTNGPRRFRAGYRSPSTGEWVLGSSVVTDAVVGYHDPDTDEWIEGVADIESGEWIPVDATRGTGARDCPAGFPVKGNLPSRVFHTPGQPDYDRTTPEVCFASEDAASAAGFRHARSRPPAAAAAPAAAEAPVAAAAPAAAAPVVAAAAPRPDAGTPPPPAPPRQTAPPPPPESNRNWLWWILAALAIAALLWWFFFRPQGDPAVEVTPEATVAAPAVTDTEEEEEDEEPVGIVATPAQASPVAAAGTPRSLVATPMTAATDDATPESSPGLATAVSDAVATAEAELEEEADAEETETP